MDVRNIVTKKKGEEEREERGEGAREGRSVLFKEVISARLDKKGESEKEEEKGREGMTASNRSVGAEEKEKGEVEEEEWNENDIPPLI